MCKTTDCQSSIPGMMYRDSSTQIESEMCELVWEGKSIYQLAESAGLTLGDAWVHIRIFSPSLVLGHKGF